MLIQPFNKKYISLILAGGLLFNPLYAQFGSFLGEMATGYAKSKINSQLSKYSNIVNQYRNLFGGNLNIAGINLNLSCLMPSVNWGLQGSNRIYAPCSMKSNYSLKIGPCVVNANFQNNPIFSQLDKMCRNINNGYTISSAMNIGFTGMSINAGLRNNADLTKIRFGNANTSQTITYQDLYGSKDGKQAGFFVNMVKKYPNSSDAKAFLTSDKKLLILKDLNLKQQASSRLSTMKLPKNISQYEININKNADIYKDAIPDIVNIISSAQSVLTTKCVKAAMVNAPSNSEYNYKDYLGCFKAYAQGIGKNHQIVYEPTGTVIESNLGDDELGTVAKLYKTIDSAIDFKYTNKLLVLKAKSKFFEYAPTENKFNLIPIQDKKDFLYRSAIWSAEETDLLGKREEERRKAHLKVRVAMRKAYIASMPFDSKKAANELNSLLQ